MYLSAPFGRATEAPPSGLRAETLQECLAEGEVEDLGGVGDDVVGVGTAELRHGAEAPCDAH